MNIFKENNPKFKQELASIIFLSTLHIWWSFNFPAFIKMGNIMRVFLGITMAIAGICIYIFAFTFPNIRYLGFNQELIDDAPQQYKTKFKAFYIAWLVIASHLGIFFAWRNNISGMSNMYYVFTYINCLALIILLIRAANREPQSQN